MLPTVKMSKTLLRPIPDFPDYFVNNLGEVWSNKRSWNNQDSKLIKLKLFKNKTGSLTGCLFVQLIRDGKRSRRNVSRLIVNAQQGTNVGVANDMRNDNYIENLRISTSSESSQNRKPYKDKTSKYKGVHWYKNTKKWCAVIKLRGKRTFLGYFEDEIDASRAYDRAAKSLFGDFARPNNV